MSDRQELINPFEDGTAISALRGLPSVEEVIARLLHTIEHSRATGFLRGAAGCGKSAVLELVATELRCGGVESGLLDLRRVSADEFAWRLACELGAAPTTDDRRRCWRTVEDTINGRSHGERQTVLFLDHLEQSDVDLLAEVRRLFAIAEASAGWCTLVIAARLDVSHIEPLIQEHAELRVELPALTLDETATFIELATDVPGCPLFTEDAVESLYSITNGQLRDLMTLSRLSLLAFSADHVLEVTAAIVKMAAGEVPPTRRCLTRQENVESLTASV